MSSQITINNHINLDWEDGLTVQKMLDKMNFTFKMLIVKVNGELVNREEYTTTKIPAEADVKVIHMISGG